MKERPILFSTAMVQAILEGRKTQTRRVIKPQPEGQPMYCYAGSDRRDHNKWLHGGKRYTPPCHGDDILWVRETWRATGVISEPYAYKADEEILYLIGEEGQTLSLMYKWRPSIHMPREAARLFLRVKNIRVERLQDITEDDARAEGVKDPYDYQSPEYYEQPHMRGFEINKSAFAGLWESIYSSWVDNPWVWVIEFEKVKP